MINPTLTKIKTKVKSHLEYINKQWNGQKGMIYFDIRTIYNFKRKFLAQDLEICCYTFELNETCLPEFKKTRNIIDVNGKSVNEISNQIWNWYKDEIPFRTICHYSTDVLDNYGYKPSEESVLLTSLGEIE
jgi:hypothetical protein